MAELIKARQLREERKRLSVQAFELANKPNNTKEDRTAANKMYDEVDDLLAQINLLERADTIDTEHRGNGGRPPNDQIDHGGSDDPVKVEKRKYDAWVRYMKFGWSPRNTGSGHHMPGISGDDQALLSNCRRAMDPEVLKMVNQQLRSEGVAELRDLGAGGLGAYPGVTQGLGATFVPVGFIYDIEQALKYYGPMLKGGVGLPTIFDTATGQPLPYPTSNDTAVMGEQVGEGQQVTTQDPTLGMIMFGAWKYSSKLVKVPLELLQDSAFDLPIFLIEQFGNRLGRIANQRLTIGVGTTEPTGIVTGSTLGSTAVGSSSNDGTSAGANTTGSDDLINLEHSVDILYRPGARYMMNDLVLRQLKTLKDKFGRPLWLPGLAVQTPDTINSYFYEVNNDMVNQQSAATSPPVTNKTMLFGQLSKYMVRRVKDMSVIRLDERFADQGIVAFVAFMRIDGQMLDAGTHPIRFQQTVY